MREGGGRRGTPARKPLFSNRIFTVGVPQASHGITKDRCLDFNQQRPPLTEGGLPVVKHQIKAHRQHDFSLLSSGE